MSLRTAVVALLAAAFLASDATSANAATITDSATAADRIEFTAASGETNDLRVMGTPDSLVFDDALPIVDESDDCLPEGDGDVRCTFRGPAASSRVFNRFDVALGDGDDRVALTDVPVVSLLRGEEGNDRLSASGRSAERSFIVGATLDGGPGDDVLEAADTLTFNLAGGTGNDLLRGSTRTLTPSEAAFGFFSNGNLAGGPGADRFVDGVGRDFVSYAERTAGVAVTLGGGADDGEPGEGDDVPADVEGVLSGAGDDVLAAGGEPVFLSGAGGADDLRGGAGDDRLVGGPGDDRHDGGGGRDELLGLDGADVLRGGPGLDEVIYLSQQPAGESPPALAVSLGSGADDGAPGEGDDVGADVEDATTDAGADRITGDERPNVLTGSAGPDRIDGGGGSDQLDGGAGDDVLEARDGIADRVVCGSGLDRAVVDELDETAGCEQEDRAPLPAPAPTAAAAPSPGPAAATDRPAGAPGAAAVTRRAPAGMTLAVKLTGRAPLRARSRGALRLPTEVAAGQGCQGIVTVQVKRGRRTLSTRRVRLTRACRYASSVVFRDRARLGRSPRLRFTARFTGNAVLGRVTSSTVVRRAR